MYHVSTGVFPVFEDRVYWSDWESSGVHYANKFDGSSPTVVARYVTGSTSIRVYHEQAQPACLSNFYRFLFWHKNV